ncbi:MAG: hypothetical protein ACJAWV_004173 [Flammeovirgaceae bacterium]
MANELNKAIYVCHFPPGTSKWNKIEHKIFCHISQNRRGKSLISREVVVNLIGRTALRVDAELDENRYEKNILMENGIILSSLKADIVQWLLLYKS